MKLPLYIEKIIENGKSEDMKELSDMLDEAIIKLKVLEPECYDKYKMKLMGMAYNYKFDYDTAYEIVNSMKPLGEYWDYETTKSLVDDYDVDDIDFYIVINSLVNDYGKVIDKGDTNTYAKMARSFILDEDAKKNKVWRYFTKIVK